MIAPRCRLLGVRVDKISMVDTLAWARNCIENNRLCGQIVVLNVAKLIKAREDATLLRSIEQADIVGADGAPLVWLSRMIHEPLPQRITGIDLMDQLLREGNEQRWSFFFFGATQEVVEGVAKRVINDFPNIRIAGIRNGFFAFEEESEIVAQIAGSEANILFIGFGSPKKEHFVDRWRDRLNVNIIHGVGGSLDVYVGKTKRAPLWMQKYGLEWSYRLIQEPRRMFLRYAVTNTIFVFLALREITCRFLRKVS